MKKSVIILLLSNFFFVTAFTQNAPKILRAYAFYTMSIPGMAMADDKGNTINPTPIIDRFIYVECPGTKMPDIRGISYDKIPYTATVTKANEGTIQVGERVNMGKDIVLNAKKGNSFWKLDLQMKKDSDKVPHDVKHISIQGQEGKRPYTVDLYNETNLRTPDRY